ncbi:hypothetical protein ACQ4M3_37920 [Leptolyngbya sp. AN03gr2]|uniref:hypothetical protein n=1 Tax=unclassified Leptolyngbya TaxID=2650499 RepID=UPI003D310D15
MNKTPKGFGKPLEFQQTTKTHQKALKKLQKKLQRSPLGEQVSGIVTSPKNEVKMSEVLEDFVEPYLDFARNRHQREKLFGIAVAAWNLALMPEAERESMIEQLIQHALQSNDPLAQQDTREILHDLIERKQTLFADNSRYIVEFQLQDLGHTFHLSVASTLSNPPVSEP